MWRYSLQLEWKDYLTYINNTSWAQTFEDSADMILVSKTPWCYKKVLPGTVTPRSSVPATHQLIAKTQTPNFYFRPEIKCSTLDPVAWVYLILLKRTIKFCVPAICLLISLEIDSSKVMGFGNCPGNGEILCDRNGYLNKTLAVPVTQEWLKWIRPKSSHRLLAQWSHDFKFLDNR